tara:strand:+ start:103 stop:378 length:276 start_codon:yes stop_codon:yes gene_type:complete
MDNAGLMQTDPANADLTSLPARNDWAEAGRQCHWNGRKLQAEQQTSLQSNPLCGPAATAFSGSCSGFQARILPGKALADIRCCHRQLEDLI